jgi:RNA polymerase sigma factor, sigma-70 family
MANFAAPDTGSVANRTGRKMRDKAVNHSDNYWQQFLKGDDEAFNNLYDQYIDRLAAWGLRYSRDKELVKDTIQELFVDIYTYRKKLRADVNVDAYLFVSLRRHLMRQLKGADALTYSEDVLNLMAESGVEEDTEQRTIRMEADRELMAILEKEVNDLPSRQQEVLQLRYTSRLSYDAVSKIMKIPVPTCRTLLNRALRQLRRRMKESFLA